MQKGLDSGTMNEEDTTFVRTALAKFTKKLADLEIEIDDDRNKAQLAENDAKANDEKIKDLQMAIEALSM